MGFAFDLLSHSFHQVKHILFNIARKNIRVLGGSDTLLCRSLAGVVRWLVARLNSSRTVLLLRGVLRHRLRRVCLGDSGVRDADTNRPI